MKSALVLFLLLAARSVSAQPSKVEVFGGLTLWFPDLDSTLDASYTPSRVGGINELFLEPDPRSHATQLLSLRGDRSLGFGLGVNVFPHPAVGFQFLLDRAEVDVSGDNPPHVVDLTYDSINFPNSDRVVRQLGFSYEAAPTEGTFDETTLSFNAVARIGAGNAVSGSLSGGLSYFRFEGNAERLSAFAAWLGGHAVLFNEVYEMSYSLSEETAIGFNVGGTLDVSLGPRAALFVDGRLLHASETDVAVTLDEILSRNVVTTPIGQIEDFLDLDPVTIDPGYFRILFGAKLKL